MGRVIRELVCAGYVFDQCINVAVAARKYDQFRVNLAGISVPRGQLSLDEIAAVASLIATGGANYVGAQISPAQRREIERAVGGSLDRVGELGTAYLTLLQRESGPREDRVARQRPLGPQT